MAGGSTIFQNFSNACDKYPDNEALAVFVKGQYQAINYRELKEKVLSLASGIASKGFKAGDKIAILLHNSPEWVMIDLAAASLGIVIVPIHTTYNIHYIEYLLEHSESSCLFVSHKRYDEIKDSSVAAKLRHIVIVGDEMNGTDSDKALHFDRLLDTKSKSSAVVIDPDDVHTIVYTSGTTGKPKGVMLTHENLISNVSAVTDVISVFPNDRFFSFMPLSHILERLAGYYVPLFFGAAIYYARDVKTLTDDIKIAQPTVIVSVPRIFEKTHEKILAKFSSSRVLHAFFEKSLHLARKHEKNELRALQKVAYATADKLIFSKIRRVFGGRLRFSVSGGASLPKHIAELFESFGIIVVEGYGLTETSPILTVNSLEKRKYGTVGKPLNTVELHIDSSGEILVKGKGIMKGYYKAPDLTAEVIDNQGWFHTGDLGSLDKDGFLTIIGRLKEMIVLSTGRNIFPVPIEAALEESKYILQAMVYGDKARAIAAFIVPEFEELKNWCAEQGIEYVLPSVLNNGNVLKFYREEILKMLVRFQSFEQVRHFKLLPKEFTQEDDMLTPSLKLKREKILGKYAY